MNTYAERAALLISEGQREHGLVNLRKQQVRGLWSWEGTFVPDNAVADLLGVRGNVQIELPNGNTGEVLIQNVQMGSNSRTNVRLLGSGPAPF